MKILYPIIDGEVTGGNMICLAFIDEAIRRNWKVVVNSPTNGKFTKMLNKKKIKVYNIKAKRTFQIDKVLKLVSIVKKESIDIIHTHTALPGMIISRIAGKLTNTSVITHEHGLFPINSKPLIGKYQIWLNKFTAKFDDKSIAVSHYTKEKLIERGMSPNKICVIYNGIEMPDLKNNKNNLKKNCYEKLDLPTNIFLVGLIGRIDKMKGQEVLIKAIPHVIKKNPSAYFLIIGEDFKGGNYIQELKNIVEKLGINKYIEFAGYRDDVIDLMNSFDLFVLPSFGEGLPVVILEAMAAGKPVIATSVGGNSEVVLDGETGTIIPPEDPEALTKAVIYHLENPEISKEMGRKGYDRVKENFTKKQMVEKTFQIYEEVLQC